MSDDDVLSAEAVEFLHLLAREFEGERAGAAGGAAGARAAVARGRAARRSWRRRRGARGRLAGAAGAGGSRRPPGRDHRADRSQDGDQRAELGRARVHGGLRGLQLADLGEHARRPAQPLGRDRAHDPARDARRRPMR